LPKKLSPATAYPFKSLPIHPLFGAIQKSFEVNPYASAIKNVSVQKDV
jgi:hypothetical protein